MAEADSHLPRILSRMPDPTERLNAALEGRYSVERELGEGGMATVYLAEEQRLQDHDPGLVEGPRSGGQGLATKIVGLSSGGGLAALRGALGI